MNKNNFSTEMSDALLNKNMSSFWKLWNAKFKSKQKTVTIDSLTDDSSIAEILLHCSWMSCKPNLVNKNRELKDKFENMYTNYLLTCTYYDQLISVADTGRCLQQKMKTWKAAGFDGITTEHLLHTGWQLIPQYEIPRLFQDFSLTFHKFSTTGSNQHNIIFVCFSIVSSFIVLDVEKN